MNIDNYKDKRIFLLLLGIIIGIASITPGLSGGVIAVSLGLYSLIIDSIINIKSQFKKSISFLLPLIIGAVIGIIIFGIIMKPLLKNYESYVIYIFTGLVLGSMPSFFSEATSKGFKITYIFPAVITFCIGILFSYTIKTSGLHHNLNTLTLLLSGGILALGMIIPGISSSFLLIQLGIYEKLISSLLDINPKTVLFVVLGFFSVSLIIIKLVHICLNKFHGQTYFAAFGFLIASVLPVIPIMLTFFEWILSILLAFIGALLSYFMLKHFQKS